MTEVKLAPQKEEVAIDNPLVTISLNGPFDTDKAVAAIAAAGFAKATVEKRGTGRTSGAGLLAGSIFLGSNRLIVTGFSPCWGGFYVSTMGGAALVFDNLGVNLLSIVGRAPMPSVLYLNRADG